MQNIIKNFSPNSSIRDGNIEFIIIHYTEMSFEGALNRLMDSNSKVSSHYLIKETGEIYQLVPDELAAWHAGKSYWDGLYSLNNHSIGIELDNLGNKAYTLPQMLSCIDLCKYLVKTHNINPLNILGHSDIAPDRKIDPGPWFNWKELAKEGLGLWYNENEIEAQIKKSAHLSQELEGSSHAIINLQKSLQSLGYKIEVTGELDDQTNCVIRAFQMHFNPQTTNFDKRSEAILQNLLANKNK